MPIDSLYFVRRPATRLDLLSLREIDSQSFDYPFDDTEWDNILEHYRVQIFFFEGHPIGFWVGRPSPTDDERYELAKIAVAKFARGKGYSAAMMINLRSEAREFHRSVLTCAVSDNFLRPSFQECCLGWLQIHCFKAVAVREHPSRLFWGERFDVYDMEAPVDLRRG